MINLFELVFLYYTPARGYSSHLLVMSINRLTRDKKMHFKPTKISTAQPQR
jgi:hypothetical protein